MLSVKLEVPSWDGKACPFCGKESIRRLEIEKGRDVPFPVIGFFTCRSCHKNWAADIDSDIAHKGKGVEP
jgi:hypothetical protein